MSGREMVAKVNDAIGAHGMWKMRLRTAIRTGKSEVNSVVAGCDNECAFGKWLYGPEISAPMRNGVPYQVIRRLHADFHRSAGQVLRHVERQEGEAAESLMAGEFTERSEKLVRALTKWKGELA